MNSLGTTFLSGLISFTLASGNVLAQPVPSLINYQGRLTDSSGTPLPTGAYGLAFRIWSDKTSTNANAFIWGQEYTNVPILNGGFNVILGSGTPITNPMPAANSLSLTFTEANRFIGITVTQGTNGVPVQNITEIIPRQQLLSTPYSMMADTSRTTQDVPPGSLLAFAGGNVPVGWLPCDGHALLEADFPALFQALARRWGGGCRSTHI